VEANAVDGSALFGRWDHIDHDRPLVEKPYECRGASVRDNRSPAACEHGCLVSPSLADGGATEHIDAMEDPM
jgi:hypothetical protein